MIQKKLIFVSKLILGSLLLYVFFKHLEVNQVLVSLQKPVWIAAVLVQPIVFFGTILLGLRLTILLNQSISFFPPIWRASVLSLGASILLPMRLWEFVKPIYLKKHLHIEFSESCAAVFFERFSDLLIILALIIFCFFLSLVQYKIWVLIVSAFILVSIVLLLLLRDKIAYVISLIPLEKTRNFLQNLSNTLYRNFKSLIFLKSIGYGILIWTSSLLVFFLFFKISNVALSLNQILTIFIFTTISCAIPIFPGAIGSYEAVLVFFLHKYGIELNQSVAYAIVLHFSQLFLQVLFAIIIVLNDRISLLDIFDIKKKVEVSFNHE